MNPDELISTLDDVAGFITTDADGKSTCTVCGATAEPYQSVQHKDDCKYKASIDTLLEHLPTFTDKFIPGAENKVSIATLLPYYAELSKSELSEIERMTQGMMRSVPIEDRIATAQEIGHWCPECDPELLQRMIENGIINEAARINVRNYFVFERVSNKKIQHIQTELKEAEEMQQDLLPVFEQMLTKKYGYTRYTDNQQQ